ncbi:hypothetical protein BaRGS_00024317, partial [Batillaria attramentaria]
MAGECRIPGHITGLYVFAVVNLFVLLNVSIVSADVIVFSTETNSTKDTFDDMQAQFGPDFPDEGLVGRLVYVNPHNACRPIDPPPRQSDYYPWIALIARGHCSFAEKALNFTAAIVHNSRFDEDLVQMAGGDLGTRVTIPSVFVGYDDGMKLAHFYNYTDKTVLIKIKEIEPYNWSMYLLPMGVVVFTMIFLLFMFVFGRWVGGIIRRYRARLSPKALRRIPIKKFKKGDYYDVCAICLEDFVEGEKMRVLPCNHAFHTKCVDPWLTRRKKTCPCCKRRVIPRKANAEADSDSDNENDAAAPNENTPLLNNSASNAPRSSANAADPESGRGTEEDAGRRFLAPVRRARRSKRSRGQPQVVCQPVSPIPEVTENSESDSESEQGAVGGVGVSDRLQEVSEEGEALIEDQPSTSGDHDASADAVVIVPDQDSDRSSPVRLEGSINAGYSSSEDDSASGSGK